MSTFQEDKEAYLRTLGYFWTTVFKDREFLDGYSTSMLVELRDLAAYGETMPDYLSRYLIPLKKLSTVRLFSFEETSRDTYATRYGQGYEYGGGDLAYGDVQPEPTTIRYDIEPGFQARYLMAGLEERIVLERGVDFTIEGDVITFTKDPLTLKGVVKRAETKEDGTISYVFFLWGFLVEEDVNAVCDFYGILAGVCTETSQTLKDAVNLAWDLRVDGASIMNTVRLLSMITGVDCVEEDGVVQLIFTEGDKVMISTETVIYSAPLGIEPVVDLGDKIIPGSIIWDAFTIRGPDDDVLQNDFEGLALGPGDVAGIDYGILLVNDIVPITPVVPPGYRTIRVV